MSRALKIKQSVFAASGSVASVNITAGGSYTTAPTATFSAPTAAGNTATGTTYLSYNATSTPSIIPGGTATIAYLFGSTFTTPATAGSLSGAQFTPQNTSSIGGFRINNVTGTAGEITFQFATTWLQGESVTIDSGAMGGFVVGDTYFIMTPTETGGATVCQLTDTYANAIAGVAALTTSVAGPGLMRYSKNVVSGTPTRFASVPGQLGQYLTAPTEPIAANITNGGQGLTLSGLPWRVGSVVMTDNGSGYSTPATVTFSSGAAAGTPVMAPASLGPGAGFVDIGFNPFSYMDSPTQAIPAGMTTDQYLGVVGGGFNGGVANSTNPTVKCTAWITNAPAEDDAYIVTQKGATRYLVAGRTTYAPSTMVAGRTYIIASLGNSNWLAFGASVNARVGDVFTATQTGSGTGLVAYAGTCSLSNVAAGSVTQGNMQITVTRNATAFRASRLTNKYVWDYATPQPNQYAADFFVGSAAAVTTLKSGADILTFANGTGQLTLGQVTNYTS